MGLKDFDTMTGYNSNYDLDLADLLPHNWKNLTIARNSRKAPTNSKTFQLNLENFLEKGKLFLGQAADLAGLTKRTFAELLGKYDVSIFNYPPSDLTRDVKNA